MPIVDRSVLAALTILPKPTRTLSIILGLAFVTSLGAVRGLMAQDIGPAAAPSAGPPAAVLAAAAQTITAAELDRHRAAFTLAGTPDSLLRHNGRDSTAPVRARRERAATYIAEAWRQLGLLPAFPFQADMRSLAASGPWVQRAPAPGKRRLNYAETQLVLETSGTGGRPPILNETGVEIALGRQSSLDFVTAAHFVPAAGPPILRETFVRRLGEDRNDIAIGSHHVLLVAGPHTAATLRALGPSTFADAVVFYVPPAGLDAAGRRAVLAELYGAGRGVVVVSEADSARFAHELQAAQREPVTVVDHYLLETIAQRRTWPWVAAVRSAAVAPQFWTGSGIELAELRTLTTPLVHELPGTEVWLMPELEKPSATDSTAADSTAAAETYPYVLGFLEGTDSVLKQQTVVITASLGDPATQATELAGLITLARAFSTPEARPRRSVLFVAAGGGPPDYAGSWLVAEEVVNRQTVAALTLEHLDVQEQTGDTLVIDGPVDIVLPRSPTWVAAAHPELGLQVVDTGTVFQPGTAALAMATHLVPGVGVRLGAAAAAAGAGATAEAVRALRFVWYLGTTLANAPAAPRWTAEGRQRYVQVMRLRP